ncbi:MAG: hypothetical protein U0793_06320 [Gemmataceae bacterium]
MQMQPSAGNYERTISGEGSYSRSSSGSGATEPTDTGSIDYLWSQVGDPESGVFTMTRTGIGRYEVLEEFYDISNTKASRSPGHMNVFPFGQLFIDPVTRDSDTGAVRQVRALGQPGWEQADEDDILSRYPGTLYFYSVEPDESTAVMEPFGPMGTWLRTYTRYRYVETDRVYISDPRWGVYHFMLPPVEGGFSALPNYMILNPNNQRRH